MTASIMPDIDLARTLLSTIGWRELHIESVPGGSVNTTFRLTEGNSTWYLRIGPTEKEVSAGPTWFTGTGLRREQQAIAMWSDHAGIFAETIHRDFTHRHIAADWVVQKAIPGDPWEAVRPRFSPDQERMLWTNLGRLIAELHAYTGPEFGPPEQGHGQTLWSDLCRWDATGLLTDAHRYKLDPKPFRKLCELVDRFTHELDEITTPRLIHSDLGLRHVMIAFDERKQPYISGLIDLEFARFADAYSETMFVEQALQTQRDPMFDTFLQGYGAERPGRSARVRSHMYQLISLGWSISDAMRRNRPGEAQEVMITLQKRMEASKHLR